MALDTPIVFLVFNRPDCAERTFAEIRRVQPRQLLVVADGPRGDHPGEAAACAKTRLIVDEGVDWPCEVRRNYSQCNLGCAERVSSGLTWAFSVAEAVIVLEDDCLPDASFFPYCEELLGKYRDDMRIGQICGTPFVLQHLERESSYVFSRYGPIWGWASWRRAWNYYDLRLQDWPRVRREQALLSIIRSRAELRWRNRLYDTLHVGPVPTWDFQWGYAKLTQSMLSVIPCKSLIENIGFGVGATHTSGTNDWHPERGQMGFPLRHPVCTVPDHEFDSAFSDACVSSRVGRALLSAKSTLGGFRRRWRRVFHQ